MNLYKSISAVLLSGFLIIGLSACEKGPAEKAGATLDDVVSDVEDQSKEAVEAVKEEIKD